MTQPFLEVLPDADENGSYPLFFSIEYFSDGDPLRRWPPGDPELIAARPDAVVYVLDANPAGAVVEGVGDEFLDVRPRLR